MLLSAREYWMVASYRIEVEEEEQKSLVEYMNLLSYHFVVSIRDSHSYHYIISES